VSSTAIPHDVLQQTVQQSASATPIRVEDHLGLVMHLAKRSIESYQGQHLLDLEDLYQEGVLGLMHAAEKFDARKGFRFSTYATYWIRWAIGQAIMNESRTIRLPTTIWPALHHLARAQAALWQQYQREPSPDELAELLKHLSPRERQVIEIRYQLGPTGAYSVEDIPLPYTEVSRQLGMTTGLVKAVETRALLKMRFWAERSKPG